MIALRKKREADAAKAAKAEAEATAAAEAAAPSSTPTNTPTQEISLVHGIGGEQTRRQKGSQVVGRTKTPCDLRLQKGESYSFELYRGIDRSVRFSST